jgi:hypothetical protein
VPAKSVKQAKLMYAVQNNPEVAKKTGISPEVAHEFTEGMTKKRWSKLKEKVGNKKSSY